MNVFHQLVRLPLSVGKTSKMMSSKCNNVTSYYNTIRKDALPVDWLVDDLDLEGINFILKNVYPG